jgi:site-specific recombinase XerD
MADLMSLPVLLNEFFHQWLKHELGCSVHTIRSYRDSWRLFLNYAADVLAKPIHALTVRDLTADTVRGFLEHLHSRRNASVSTRNCRLAALHSVFRYLADREPLAALQCNTILQIPMKKGVQRKPQYLESREIEAILRQPDTATREGHRDKALFTLLYNTGARIQEALDLRVRSVSLDSPRTVTLLGKGQKERTLAIWKDTAQWIRSYLRRTPSGPDDFLFVNRYGRQLTRSGARFRLKGYVARAAKTEASLRRHKVSAHTFRHTAAVHLVSSGVNVEVIRAVLGHADVGTTNHYSEASAETKRAALERVGAKRRPSQPPRWRRDNGVLQILDSL